MGEFVTTSFSLILQMSVKKGRDFWGPPVWTTLHTFAAAYTPKKAGAFKQFVSSLPDLMPCESCCNHLRDNLKKYPPDAYMRDNHSLFMWSYLLHDTVNIQRAKHHPEGEPIGKSPPYDQVKAFYFNALADECAACKTK